MLQNMLRAKIISKLKLLTFLCCSSTISTSAHAVTALEVQPQDIYRAAYCAEINRLSGFPDYKHVRKEITNNEAPFNGMSLTINLEPEISKIRKDPISELAAKLITGGDNLEFVKIGIEDARRDINSVSGSELTQCNIDLVKILENYEWMPCGYGNLRQLNRSKTKMLLSKLQIIRQKQQ